MSTQRSLLVVVLLLAPGCSAEPPSNPPEPRFEFGCPDAAVLACTGLYGPAGEHWYSKRVGRGVNPFKPAAELWSDGMAKHRWIELPTGTQIDTSKPDNWVFPLGTKLWKEFAYEGKRVETRYLEKRAGYWHRTTYRWNADGSNAFELVDGELDVPGTLNDSYEIPKASACVQCHQGAADEVLGFSAVMLGDGATGLTTRELTNRKLVTTELPSFSVPGTPLERSALQYLHANCGLSCHNPSLDAEAWWTGFYMRLELRDLATLESTATYRTGVAKESYIVAPHGPKRYLDLLAPGWPDESAVIYRASQRGSDVQMPPVATHVVDDQGLALLRSFITQLP